MRYLINNLLIYAVFKVLVYCSWCSILDIGLSSVRGNVHTHLAVFVPSLMAWDMCINMPLIQENFKR